MAIEEIDFFEHNFLSSKENKQIDSTHAHCYGKAQLTISP